MSEELVVSNEYLAVGGDRVLGKIIQGHVENITKKATERQSLFGEDFDALVKDIRKLTGLNLGYKVVSGHPLNASMRSYNFHGHHGVTGSDLPSEPPAVADGLKSDPTAVLSSTVDLVKVRVTGWYTNLPFEIQFPTGLFDARTGMTAEGATAIILHEIGHAFNICMSTGDYVWLNYFLQDGVEVVLGRKANKYRVDILSVQALAKIVDDPKLAEALRTAPTEQNVRRALMVEGVQRQRDHLHSTTGSGALKRDEQLADWFASRMGYGRALVVTLHKFSRNAERYRVTKGTHNLAESLKVLKLLGIIAAGSFFTALSVVASLPVGMVVFPLFTALCLWNLVPDSEITSRMDEYDNSPQRLNKIKLDLVSQLKSPESNAESRLQITEDLAIVEGILKHYQEHQTLYQVAGYVLSGTNRRKAQNLKLEQHLESLLNNDLFSVAHKFNTSSAGATA